MIQLMLQTVLLSNINYIILAMFQQMSDIRLIGFCKYYCKSLNIKIVLTPFKVADIFNMKDPILKSLKSFVVSKFVCSGCNPVTLVRQLAISQQGLRSIWKWTKNTTFLYIL